MDVCRKLEQISEAIMRARDIIGIAARNLWHRRRRTALNLIGVAIGSGVLLMTLSVTSGLRSAIHAMIDATEFARSIYVHRSESPMQLDAISPKPPESALVVEGEMDPARRKRIRDALADVWQSENQQKTMAQERKRMEIVSKSKPISAEDMLGIKRIEHVQEVVPGIHQSCRVMLDGAERSSVLHAANLSSGLLRQRLLVGQFLTENDRDGVLMDEFLAYQMGFRSDAQLAELLGKTIEIEAISRADTLRQLLESAELASSAVDLGAFAEYVRTGQQLLADLDRTTLDDSQKRLIRQTLSKRFLRSGDQGSHPNAVRRRLTVRGILRLGTDADLIQMFRYSFSEGSYGLRVVPSTALDLASQQADFRGMFGASVFVDSVRNIDRVTEKLEQDGYRCASMVQMLKHVEKQIDQGKWLLVSVAMLILLVTAIGIGIMLMISVIERTTEFGILKAVGAKDQDVVCLVLCEGAVLGLLGTLLAALVALLCAWLGNDLLLHLLLTRFNMKLDSNLFLFSPTAMLTVTLCSVWICMSASAIPAWRAARLDPIVAMRRV